MRYDAIVIGAGSAGAVVGTRLSEDRDRSVLLLKAGQDYPDFERLPDELKYGYATGAGLVTSGHDWNFVGKANDVAPPMLVPRGKVTGGSSAINGQVILRGAPEDFDRWAAWGSDRWTFEQVLPYFRKLETDLDLKDDFHGSDGPIESCAGTSGRSVSWPRRPSTPRAGEQGIRTSRTTTIRTQQAWARWPSTTSAAYA